MDRITRVLLVDDDDFVRGALTMLLDGAEGISVVGEATDGDQVPAAVAALFPHVVLMDLRMPKVNGITATRAVRRRPGAPEVIVLTTFDTDENVLHALRAGASGFLLKDSPPAQITAAIHQVAAGEPMLSPQITRRLMDRVTMQADTYQRARTTLSSLTPREHDVALSVAHGLGNADIATRLGMSTATVKAHISRILDKLELNNRTQIAILAHDAELL
jgi:DNA-binding NarL/FixJ family response regulator